MAAGDPRPGPIYRFTELPPDRFEDLVFRLAWAEDRTVVQLRAPDGGLDTLSPDPERDGKARRGWQPKRYTGGINWGECEESLDRSVSTWDSKRVTFVFPRNLTGGEHATFAERLGKRHADVTVDYWAEAELRARLDSDEGKRIAPSFFEPQDAVALAERLLRAGSPLRGGEDVVDAEFAIGEAVAEAQLDFDWVVHRSRTDQPPPELAPGCVLRLALERGDSAFYADLVPRRDDAGPLPAMAVILDDSEAGRQARAWLDELLNSGRSGRLALDEGATVQITDVPAPFGDLVGDEAQQGELTLRVVVEPPPFFARLTVGEGDDAATLDIDLRPGEPSEDWDGVLSGQIGGLSVAMPFRWFIKEGRGEVQLLLLYKHNQAPHEVEARVLRWFEAMYRAGKVTIEDRRGLRPPMTEQLERSEIPAWLPAWARLHEALVVLETAAGRPAPSLPADSLSETQVRGILEAANMVTAGISEGDLTEFTTDIGPGNPASGGTIIRNLVTKETLVIMIGEEEMRVAQRVMHAPPLIVRERAALPGGGWRLICVPLGAESAKAMVEFVPLSETGRVQGGGAAKA